MATNLTPWADATTSNYTLTLSTTATSTIDTSYYYDDWRILPSKVHAPEPVPEAHPSCRCGGEHRPWMEDREESPLEWLDRRVCEMRKRSGLH
jgi:hypothetical protein